MQNITLFISQNYLKFWVDGHKDDGETQPHSGGMDGLLEAIPLALEAFSPLETPKVMVVLDHGLSFYRHLQFPPLKPSKVKKVLPFELENQLIYSLDKVSFATKIKKFSQGKASHAGVFFAKAEEVTHIKKLILKSGFELAGVTCLSGLLDQTLCTQAGPDDGLYLFLDSHQGLILSYEDGFLTEVSQVRGQNTTNQQLKAMNGRVKASLFELGESTLLHLGGELSKVAEVTEHKEIILIDPKAKPDLADIFPKVMEQALTSGALVKLIQVQAKGVKEIAKSFLKFQKLAILLVIWLLVYLGGVGYQLMRQGSQLEQVKKQHRVVASRFAPGVPPSRALRTIKNRLKNQGPVGQNPNHLWTGPLPFEGLLLKISRKLQKIEGMKLVALSYNLKGLNLRGQVASLAAMEQVKEASEKLFPTKKYRVRFSQKPGPDDSVLFTLSVGGAR